MRLVLIGSIALVGTLGLLAYKRNKLIYVVSSLLFIIGIGAWYFSSQNHISINQDYISKQVFFNKYQYQWKQIDEIVYEYAMSGKGDYTFTAKTGEQFIIKENELRTDAKGQIYKTAIQNDIPYTERAK